MSNEINELLSSLSPSEYQTAMQILSEVSDNGTSNTLVELYNEDFIEIPVDIDTFVESPDYAGWFTNNGRGVYPYWRERLREIFSDNSEYSEIAFTGSIGSGKSHIAVLGLAYTLYWLMCVRDPYEYFGLAKGSLIYIVFFNTTLTLSQGVAYTKFQSLLQNSPWFMRHGKLSGLKNVEYIPDGPIAFSTGSQMEHSLGKDIFCLTGDTEIFTENGITKLEDLNNKYVRVYTKKDSGEIELTNIPVLIKKTKSVTKLLEIELEDGTILRCTEDHKFRLSTGEYVEAKDLNEDMDLDNSCTRFSGIYSVTNLINGKRYIGKSETDVMHRLNMHRIGKKSNKYLQNSIKKYGIDNFRFEIIEICDRKMCNERERYWIEYYDSFNNGYNYTSGGEGLSGWRMSEQGRKKISKALKNRTFSEESRKKMSESGKNKKISESTRRKLSERFSGSNNPQYGKPLCENTRKALSYANSHLSEEKRRIISKSRTDYNTGRIWINNGKDNKFVSEDEYRSEYSLWNKGRIQSNSKKIGTIFINDGVNNKQIRRDELDEYISSGWTKGMIRRRNSK